MDDSSAATDDESSREKLRAAFEPRVQRWAGDRGLVALLHSLEDWPHTFALPAAAIEADGRRPWEPRGTSEREITLAYRRATLHLHPDRLSAANRDLSVRVEAEEVLKVLTHAHASKDSWLDAGTSSGCGVDLDATSAARAPSGDDVRDSVFGARSHAPPRTAAPQQHRPATAQASDGESSAEAGVRDIRDEVFGGTYPDAPTPSRATAQPSVHPSAPRPNPFNGLGEGEQPPADPAPTRFSSMDSAASAADDLFRTAPSAPVPASPGFPFDDLGASGGEGSFEALFRTAPEPVGAGERAPAPHGLPPHDAATAAADDLFRTAPAREVNLNDLFKTMP